MHPVAEILIMMNNKPTIIKNINNFDIKISLKFLIYHLKIILKWVKI